MPCIDSNKCDGNSGRHVRQARLYGSTSEPDCMFAVLLIYREHALRFAGSFFPFFLSPFSFSPAEIPETFALFMRVRLKPRSAVYHLNGKYWARRNEKEGKNCGEMRVRGVYLCSGVTEFKFRTSRDFNCFLIFPDEFRYGSETVRDFSEESRELIKTRCSKNYFIRA